MDRLWTAWRIISVTTVVTSVGIEGADRVNVALGKPTEQHSTTFDGVSGNAVDGNRDPNFSEGSCTHTNSGSNTWWLVDLLASYPIHSVYITNRQFASHRLSDFHVYASDMYPLPIPSTDGSFIGHMCVNQTAALPPAGPHIFQVGQTCIGRYVYIVKTDGIQLVMCEFEVMVDQINVNLQSDTFNKMEGTKSSLTPFYSVTISIPSSLLCVATCRQRNGSDGVATVVQVEKSTCVCECIQKSRFSANGTEYVLDNQWTLVESKRN